LVTEWRSEATIFQPPLEKWLTIAGSDDPPEDCARCLSGRSNVMVHPEQVARVVLLLQRGEAFVIAAVGRLEARLALIVHHEVRVGATEIERMDRVLVVLRPFLQDRGHRRIRVDSDDRHRPGCVRAVPGGFNWIDDLIHARATSIAEIAHENQVADRYVSHMLELALRPPALVEAILDGR
jgi:hypothetical protein